MTFSSLLLFKSMQRLILGQALIVLVISTIIALKKGYYSASSGLYGGGIAIIITLLRGWRINNFSNTNKMTSMVNMLYIYLGAAERFVGIIIGMAIGISWLDLDPPMIIIGFAAAQFAYLIKMPDQSVPIDSLRE